MVMASMLLAWCFHAELKGNYIPASWSGVEVPTNAVPGNTWGANTVQRFTRDTLHSLWCAHESYLQHKYFGLSTNAMSAADRLLISRWANGYADSNRFTLPHNPGLGTCLGAYLAEAITNIEVELHNDANPANCSVWGDAGYLLPSNGYWTVGPDFWDMTPEMEIDLANAWDSDWMFWPVSCTRSWSEWLAAGADRAPCVFDMRVVEQFLKNLNQRDISPMWGLFEDELRETIQSHFRGYDPAAFHRGRPRDMPYMQDVACRLRGWPDASAWWPDYSAMVDIETSLTAIGKDVDTRRYDVALWANINYCLGPLRYLCQYQSPDGNPLTAPARWRKVTTAGSSGWLRPARANDLASIYRSHATQFDAAGAVTFQPNEAVIYFGQQQGRTDSLVTTNTVSSLSRLKILEPAAWSVSPITLARPVGMTPSDLEQALGGVAYSGIYTMAEFEAKAVLTNSTVLDLYNDPEANTWVATGGVISGSYESDDALTITGGWPADVVGDTSGTFYTQGWLRVLTNNTDAVRGYKLDAEAFSRPGDAFPDQAWLRLKAQLDAEVNAAVSAWSAGTVNPPGSMDLAAMYRRYSAVGAADEYVTNYVSHITGPDLPGVVTIRWLRTDRDSLEKVDTPQDDKKIVDISIPPRWTCFVSCDVDGFLVELWNGRDDPYSIAISLLFPWEDRTAEHEQLALPPRIEDIPGAYDSHGCTQQLETIITPAGYANMRIGDIDYKPGKYMRVNGVDYLGHPDGDFATFGFESVEFAVSNPGGNAAGIHTASNLTVTAEADLKGIAIITPPAGYFSLEAR